MKHTNHKAYSGAVKLGLQEFLRIIGSQRIFTKNELYRN